LKNILLESLNDICQGLAQTTIITATNMNFKVKENFRLNCDRLDIVESVERSRNIIFSLSNDFTFAEFVKLI
jgi:spore cortex formation protein SpoVR/YcgB (stage V sporulation)